MSKRINPSGCYATSCLYCLLCSHIIRISLRPPPVYFYMDFPLCWHFLSQVLYFSQMLGLPYSQEMFYFLFLVTSPNSGQKFYAYTFFPPSLSYSVPNTQVLFYQKGSGPIPVTFMTTLVSFHLLRHACSNLREAQVS